MHMVMAMLPPDTVKIGQSLVIGSNISHLDRNAPTVHAYNYQPLRVCCAKQSTQACIIGHAVVVDDAMQHAAHDDGRRSSPRLTKRRRHGHARRQ